MSQTAYRTHHATEVTEQLVGQKVTLAGWVDRRRDHGGVAFIDLRDNTGLVQVVIYDEEMARPLRSEFVIQVVGEVRLRPDGNENEHLATGKIEITSQNHSYAVDVDSLAGTGLELTHVNLLDGTAEGVECVGDAVFSMQYHPESASGPQDSGYLFRKFTKIMEERKNA